MNTNKLATYYYRLIRGMATFAVGAGTFMAAQFVQAASTEEVIPKWIVTADAPLPASGTSAATQLAQDDAASTGAQSGATTAADDAASVFLPKECLGNAGNCAPNGGRGGGGATAGAAGASGSAGAASGGGGGGGAGSASSGGGAAAGPSGNSSGGGSGGFGGGSGNGGGGGVAAEVQAARAAVSEAADSAVASAKVAATAAVPAQAAVMVEATDTKIQRTAPPRHTSTGSHTARQRLLASFGGDVPIPRSNVTAGAGNRAQRHRAGTKPPHPPHISSTSDMRPGTCDDTFPAPLHSSLRAC
jgi:hypothetical protein